MVFLENLKSQLETLKPQINELHDVYDIENIKERIEELHEKAAEPGFWDDIDNSQKVLQETRSLEGKLEKYKDFTTSYEDIEVMLEMAAEEDDDSMIEEIRQEVETLRQKLDEASLATLLTGEYDKSNAIINLHAGAGGTEAQDWTEMLFRMYSRWAEKHNFKVSTLDFVEGGEAGLKSVTLMVEGENAYGYLKSEAGVHRLVRISPYNAAGKRQTSFSSCDVMPDIKEDLNIEIKDDEIRVDTYRSSGAGGQHINKTSSAIRITHLPTGIVVTCQNERSQHMNKDKAMQMLKTRLLLLKEEENAKKLSDIRGEVKDSAFGSQIRSYVLQPYKMVKDTRTGEETSNADAVLDGDIDRFINAYLMWLINRDKDAQQ